MHIIDLRAIDKPIPLTHLTGKLFDGIIHQGQSATVNFAGGLIDGFSIAETSFAIPREIMVLPGGIDLHGGHGRDCYDILPGTKGDETHKEDSFTLALALAQGGATRGMCMPNLGRDVITEDQYNKQLAWINNPVDGFRPGPIMPLEQYVLIKGGTVPFDAPAMYKLMWNTFGRANLESDEQVREVLSNYMGRWVTAHCETISDIVNDFSKPHHEQRPKKGCINATRMFLDCAKEFRFHPHVAHIGTPEEVDMIQWYREYHDVNGTCEITPQVLALNWNNFVKQTGLPIEWAQQNPALPSAADMIHMRGKVRQGLIYMFATDHAPHTKEEKLAKMSGMPQASTAAQVYLDLVDRRTISLADFVRMRSTNPGTVLDRNLGIKAGRIKRGYEGSFTLISKQKNRITDADVLSKCGWTPYRDWSHQYQVEGVVVKGTLYTQAALRKLSEEYKKNAA